MTKPLYFAISLGLIVIAGSFIWMTYSKHSVKLPEAQTAPFKITQAIDSEPRPPSGGTDTRSDAPIATTEKITAAKKLEILNEIFKSKNDNDPRLDQDLKNLSPTDKTVLKEKYNQLPIELRNERGTIIFLLGRNINHTEDLAFMSQVFSEPKCLSLEDCSKSSTENASDHTGNTEITLAYPQIMALKALENYLLQNPYSSSGREALKKATQSTTPFVSRLASQIAHRITR